MLVRKKDGGIRVCLDLRKVNTLTYKGIFPCPRLVNLVDTLAGATVFSTLDIKMAFHHVPLSEDSKPLTAFSTSKGTYQFKRMGMGAKNSAATFQRLINSILEGIQIPGKATTVHSYFDDVTVASFDMTEHIDVLDSVLQGLLKANLHLKAPK